MLERRPSAATAGVVGLAAVAIGLSYLALTSTSSAAPTASAGVFPSHSATAVAPTATTSARPTATASVPSTTVTGASTVTAPELPLAVVSGTVAWRAGGGACADGSPSTVEVTTDGGGTWRPTSGPGVKVVAISASDASTASVVGLDDTCTRVVRRTTDGGATWKAASTAKGLWSASARSVISPAGSSAKACAAADVVSVVGTDATTAYVLCSDGNVRLTVDSGATYVTQSVLAGASALAVAGDGVLYAARRGASDCAGVWVDASGDEGVTWNPVRCVAEATGTPIGLGAAGRAAMLQSGDKVFVSPDSGVTWTPAS